ncbi:MULTISPECIES: hypothetical protein [unclassified Microcoleus]|uniref:hypothetical protein n=1 Tax=unclassified Microcoleus TaxID=2642155 RepID=UPI002FD64FE8
MFRCVKLITALPTIALLSVFNLFPRAIAQEYPGCFQLNSERKQYESLDRLCRFPKPPENPRKPDPFRVQLVNGLELTGLAMENTGTQRFLVGRLTNKQSKTAKVQSISVQFIDKRDGAVVEFLTVGLGGVLTPNQGYEFRRIMDNALQLGDRSNNDLSIKFLEWKEVRD